MDAITLKINYKGAIKLNKQPFIAPLSLRWFPDNNLEIDVGHEKILFNTATHPSNPDGQYEIIPTAANSSLEIVKDVNIKLAKNNVSYYVLINDKLAVKLPRLDL